MAVLHFEHRMETARFMSILPQEGHLCLRLGLSAGSGASKSSSSPFFSGVTLTLAVFCALGKMVIAGGAVSSVRRHAGPGYIASSISDTEIWHFSAISRTSAVNRFKLRFMVSLPLVLLSIHQG
jgi:hypothetical protein